jgi:hypothetical protein
MRGVAYFSVAKGQSWQRRPEIRTCPAWRPASLRYLPHDLLKWPITHAPLRSSVNVPTLKTGTTATAIRPPCTIDVNILRR